MTLPYQRIQPFPEVRGYDLPELRALSSIWLEQKEHLEQDDVYKEFVKKLQREWAIETGIIERLYSWDRGVTEILIEQGIESSIIAHRGGISQRNAEHIQAVIHDHLDIVEGLFGYIKGESELTEHFIRGLQAQFTAHQDNTEAITASGERIHVPLQKGKYKTLPNNPRRPNGEIHAYCPPEFTQDEMQALVRMYHEAEDRHTPEVKAAWLHHRFTQIHPFQDGNGRVARALASLVFLRAGLFPLVIRDSDREEYIGALEAADTGDLTPLITFFARRQRDAVLKALGLEQQAQQSKQGAEQIMASALEILRDRLSREQKKVSVVYDYAKKLLTRTNEKFHLLATTLDSQLRTLTPSQTQARYHACSNQADDASLEQRHYFQKQIVDIAKHFDYFANIERYRSWARVTLTTNQDFDYVVSFHGYGAGATGILAASAFTYVKAKKEEGGTEPVALHPATTEFFQFNYAESYASTEQRFVKWLEDSIKIALAEWKRSLQTGA